MHISLTDLSKLAAGLTVRMNVHLSLCFCWPGCPGSPRPPAPCDASWTQRAGWMDGFRSPRLNILFVQ